MKLILLLAFVLWPAFVFAQRIELKHLPRSEELLIQEHLRRIVAAGWAETTPGDLYHGHILLRVESRKIKKFCSLEKLLKYRVFLLYHSDEQLRRWRLDDGELPVEKKRPRSIVGYPDGRIVPAASLLVDPVKSAVHYEWFGSIHSDDLARELSGIDMHQCRDVCISGKIYSINLIFDFGLGHSPERTIKVYKDELKVTIDCRPTTPH